MFYVYVLQSDSDDGLYIGFSTDLRRRLAEHKAGKAFATSYRGPWRLIYYEAYLEEADALGREWYLKSGGGRRFLRASLKMERGCVEDQPQHPANSRTLQEFDACCRWPGGHRRAPGYSDRLSRLN
jgi:putative endonuclease